MKMGRLMKASDWTGLQGDGVVSRVEAVQGVKVGRSVISV